MLTEQSATSQRVDRKNLLGLDAPVLKAVDLFSGVGGLALGVASAGFNMELLVEKDPGACRVLRANVVPGRPINVPAVVVEEELTQDSEFDPGLAGIDLLTAGPPCQPYSSGGKRNGHTDARDMFPSLFHAVRSLRPRAILLENVWGLTIGKFREYFEYLVSRTAFPHVALPGEDWVAHKAYLADLQQRLNTSTRDAGDGTALADTYDVWCAQFNAADFGVPQLRRRAFIIAFRRDQRIVWNLPVATHSKQMLLSALRESGSYWRDHSNAKPCLPRHLILPIEGSTGESGADLFGKDLVRWTTLRDSLASLTEPKDGVQDPAFLNHVGVPGARVYPGHSGSVLDWPAKTIKCGVHGIGGGENVLLREDGSCRWLTIRECALVQGFPLDWDFGEESRSHCMRYIGNAVPPPLARQLAESIRLALEQRESPHRQIGRNGAATGIS